MTLSSLPISASSAASASAMAAPDPSVRLRWYWLLLVWAAAILVMASHRPSSLLHAQFWAEDGKVWYQQAYQEGPIAPLEHIQDGYFQTCPRLIADVSLLLPFHLAPLAMNILALLVQGLPVVFLLSSRTEKWGSPRARVAMALLYLCLPNSAEWHANTTNTQWILALLAVLVLLARPPRGWPGRAGDIAILVLSGATGPFCILLVPVAGVMAWSRRERWRSVCLFLVLVSSALQAYGLIINWSTTRIHHPLGASLSLLSRILAVRIFAGATIGTFFPLSVMSVPIIVPALLCLVCVALMLAGLRHASLELRLFTLFAVEIFAAALRTPTMALQGPQWPVILTIPNARYYLFPMLAFLLCVACAARFARMPAIRIAALCCLCLVPIGAVRNWKDYGRWEGFAHYGAEFPAEARRFEQAPPGTVTVIEIAPGPPWAVRLIKRGE